MTSRRPVFRTDARTVSRSSGTTVYFDDVGVPAERLIGEEDMGWRHLVDTLNTERLVTAADCLATADIALGIASEYARGRIVFGRPIGSNQAFSSRLRS